MFKFLKEDDDSWSSMRVFILIMVLAISFNIVWTSLKGDSPEWLNISALLSVLLGAKIWQKNVEVKADATTQAMDKGIQQIPHQ